MILSRDIFDPGYITPRTFTLIKNMQVGATMSITPRGGMDLFRNLCESGAAIWHGSARFTIPSVTTHKATLWRQS